MKHTCVMSTPCIACVQTTASAATFTPRGFEDFVHMTDEHDNDITIRESSVFPPQAVWVFCHPKNDKSKDATPYLTKEQAVELAKGLLRFAQKEEK
jgi:hypothetical protein